MQSHPNSQLGSLEPCFSESLIVVLHFDCEAVLLNTPLAKLTRSPESGQVGIIVHLLSFSVKENQNEMIVQMDPKPHPCRATTTRICRKTMMMATSFQFAWIMG